jgi:hypothetical protein
MRTLSRCLPLLLLLSCGGEGQNAQTVPLAQMPAALKKALCDKVMRCCSPTDLMANPKLGTTSESCQMALDGEATFFLGDVQTSVAGGRLVYHPDKMASCLATIEARSCDQLKMPPGDMDVTDLCGAVFEPKVPAGGACTEYWDCSGGWCEGDLGNLQDHCSPLKPEGGDCDEGPECMSGMCGDDRVCIKRPAGSGNICYLGSENVGQHGPPPKPPAP